MIAAWTLYAVGVAILLFAAARGTEYVVRALGLPTRFVWCAALAIATTAPALSLFRAPEGAPIAARASTAASPENVAISAPTATTGEARELSRSVTTFGTTRLSGLDRPIAWLVISAPIAALLYLLLAFARMRRLERSLDSGILDGHAVLLSDDFGPALLGLRRARIVVPRWLLGFPESDRRMVLAHERAHADAHDPALLAFATCLVALQPWNVAAWWLYARSRLAIETDCDHRVLEAHGDARQYGRLLLAIHERAAGGAMPRVAFVHRTTNLEQRIRRIVERRPRLTAGRGAVVCASTLAVVAAACEMPAPPTRARELSATVQSARNVSVIGVQPQCMRPRPDAQAWVDGLNAIALERHPDLTLPDRASRSVVALVLDENCNLTRDTVLANSERAFDPDKMFPVAFPDLQIPPKSAGIAFASNPSGPLFGLRIIYAIVPSAAYVARRDRDECGFGIRFEELCYAEGPAVIRMMDSVRILIAVRRFNAANQPAEHLFLVVLRRPNPAISSQRLAHANVQYHSGALWIANYLTRDAPYLFASDKSPYLARDNPFNKARKIDDLIGVAHYGTGWLTLEQIESLKPAATCEGPRGACYEAGGGTIEFPA